MMTLINLVNQKEKFCFLAVCLIAIIAGSVLAFPWSFISRMNVMVGFFLFPFVIFFSGKQRFNYLYFVLMGMFALLTMVYNVRMFYFFLLAFYILFFIEFAVGKIDELILVLIVLMSPFFQQVAVIMGFSFRLKLSEWAGQLLSFAGMPVHVEGNSMTMMDNLVFTVDEACTGLSMLAISLLIGLFLIAYQYRTTNMKLPFLVLLSFFGFTFILNVIGNLLRIIFLVLFRVTPEDPLHQLGGLISLIMYVVIPVIFISRWMINRFGIPLNKNAIKVDAGNWKKALLIVLSMCVLASGFHLRQKRKIDEVEHTSFKIKGLEPEEIKGGITKFADDEVLVYVKPIPEFFSGEHTPILCWRGSGYRFEHVTKLAVGRHKAFFAKLLKDEDTLFTAWYYTNGSIHTVDQYDWRIRMLRGEEKFSLVNVTASDPEILRLRLESLLEGSQFASK